MAVVNDQDVRRIHTTSNGIPLGALRQGADAPPVPQRVTRLRPRPAAVEQPEQLPLAVGFGSAIDLQPCRLWAVPGLPADLVAAPVELDDQWPDDEWTPTLVAPGEVPGGIGAVRLDRLAGDRRKLGMGASRTGLVPVRESAPISLTARGRLVLMLLAAAVGAVVVVFAWFGAAGSTAPTRAAQPAQITVHDGDTLWSIAGKVAPNHDPRAEIARLQQLNHLRSPALVPGQILLTR